MFNRTSFSSLHSHINWMLIGLFNSIQFIIVRLLAHGTNTMKENTDNGVLVTFYWYFDQRNIA